MFDILENLTGGNAHVKEENLLASAYLPTLYKEEQP
jgi:hypothetical protein